MSSLSDIEKFLPISKPERKVYSLLLEHGTLDSATLKQLTSIQDDLKLEDLLTKLKEKRMIISIDKEPERFHILPPFEVFTVKFGNLKSETLDLLDKFKTKKEKIITNLSEASTVNLENFNEGANQIKQQFEKYSEETIETIEESQKIMEELPLEDFFQDVKDCERQSEEIFQNLKNTLFTVVNQGKKVTNEQLKTSMENFKKKVTDFKTTSRKFSSLLTDLRSKTEEKISQKKESFVENGNILKNESETKIADIRNICTQLQSNLSSSMEDVRKKLKDFVEEAKEDLSSHFLSSLSNLEELYTRKIERLESELLEKHEEVISKTIETLEETKVKTSKSRKEEHAKIDETINTNFSQLNTKQEKIKENVTSQLEKLQGILQEQLNEFHNKETTLLENKRNKVSENLEQLLEKTDEALKATKETFNETISKIMNIFTILQEEITSKTLETISLETKMALRAKMDISATLREVISNALNHFSNKMKNIIRSEEQAMKDLTVEILNTIEEDFRKFLEEGEKEYISFYNTRKREIAEEIKNKFKKSNIKEKEGKINSLIDKGDHILSEFNLEEQNESLEELKEIFSKLKKETSSMAGIRDNLLKEIIGNITNDPPHVSQQISEITGKMAERLNEVFHKKKKESEEIYRKKNEDLWKTLETEFSQMQESMDNLLLESEEKLERITDEIQERLNTAKIELKEQISGKFGESQEVIRKGKNQILKQFSSLNDELGEEVLNVNTLLTDVLTEQKKASKQIMEETKQYMEKRENTTLDFINSSIMQFNDITKDTRNTLLEANAKMEKTNTVKFEKTIDDVKNALLDSKKSAKNSINERRENLNRKMHKEIGNMKEGIETSVKKRADLLKTEESQMISKMDKQIKDELSEVNQQLVRLQENFAELVVNTKNEIISTINSIHNSLSDGVENINSELSGEIKELSATGIQVANNMEGSLFSDLKEIFKDCRKEQGRIISDNKEKITGSLHDLKEALTKIQSTLEAKKEKYQKVKSNYMQENLLNLYNQIDILLKNLKEDSEDTQRTVKEDIEESFQGTQEKLLNTIEQYQSLKETALKIEEIFFEDIERKIDDICHIYGRQGIISQIMSMKKRTTQSFTLITPTVPKEIVDILGKGTGITEVIIPKDLELKIDLDKVWVRRTDKQIKGMTVIRDGMETLFTSKEGFLDKGVLFTLEKYNLSAIKI